MTATRGTDLGTLRIGAWTARPLDRHFRYRSIFALPRSRASGEYYPVAPGDGIAFFGDDGRPQTTARWSMRTWVVSGVTPAGAVLDVDALRHQGGIWLRNSLQALRLHQPRENHPAARTGAFEIRGGRRDRAAGQLAPHRRDRALRADCFGFYDTPVGRGDAETQREQRRWPSIGDRGVPMIRVLVHDLSQGVLLGGGGAPRQRFWRCRASQPRTPYSRLTPTTKLNAVTAFAAWTRSEQTNRCRSWIRRSRARDLPLRPFRRRRSSSLFPSARALTRRCVVLYPPTKVRLLRPSTTALPGAR